MQKLVMEVKREAESLIQSGEIQDYSFGSTGKHRVINFQHNGIWSYVTFARTPRTEYVNNFVRQQIRRRIRGAA